mgnify:FL=1|jgi:hypothetical protein|tara:strand:+ start:921 stop:1184 length:264 start_codon:yes stop_codon:yes gene_type:complete
MGKTIITEEATSFLIQKALTFMEKEEPTEEQAEIMFDMLCDELLEILPGDENIPNRTKLIVDVLTHIAMQSGMDFIDPDWRDEDTEN